MIPCAVPPSDPSRALTLVIDDDESVRKTCVELLRNRGHKTLAAASVREGLLLFAERRPAAVLLDLKLPDADGMDILEWHEGPGSLLEKKYGPRPWLHYRVSNDLFRFPRMGAV